MFYHLTVACLVKNWSTHSTIFFIVSRTPSLTDVVPINYKNLHFPFISGVGMGRVETSVLPSHSNNIQLEHTFYTQFWEFTTTVIYYLNFNFFKLLFTCSNTCDLKCISSLRLWTRFSRSTRRSVSSSNCFFAKASCFSKLAISALSAWSK